MKYKITSDHQQATSTYDATSVVLWSWLRQFHTKN